LETTTKKEGAMQTEKDNKTQASNEQTYLTDLTVPFVKYLSLDNIKFLYKVIKPLAKVRKK
jgi:hypothetical protein